MIRTKKALLIGTIAIALMAGGLLLPPSTGGASDAGDWRTHAQRGLEYLAQVKENADPSYYPKAEKELRLSLALNDKGNFEATYGMATLGAGRHDFHSGLLWARRAIASNPHSSDALGVLGDSLLELGRYDAAEATFQRMVDLKPALPAFARISYLRELRGDTAGAIAAMRLALDSAGTPDDAAFAAFQIGELHLGEGRVERARAAYLLGTRLAPGSVVPRAGLAKIAVANGDPERALRLMEEVIRTNKEPGYAIFLGDLHTYAGNDAEAEKAYELAEWLEAREEANGTNVNLESSLYAADHGDPVEALRKASEEYASRRSVHVADAYAWALYRNGRYTEAARVSHESFRLGTRNALFHFHAGMIAYKLGDEAAARNHLRTALSLNPVFSLLHIEEAEATLAALTA